jgi:hypothetical protein
MKPRWLCIFPIFFLVVALFCQPQGVEAARGIPQSPGFGYGVRLELSGNNLTDALQTAAILQVDWVIIDLDWGKQYPEEKNQPDLVALNQAMELARRFEIPVVISLNNPPAWAKTASGPDPELTARFVLYLAQRYPQALQAIELFPGANTLTRWGANPDPKSYLAVYNAAQNAIKQADLPVLLVAAGLTPLSTSQPSAADIDDLSFLQGLYRAGTQDAFPVISLHLQEVVGEPTQAPDGIQHCILRHYEEVRQVMLDNGDAKGILWITSFTWNSGKNQLNDVSLTNNLEAQSEWLAQAYQQLRSQLYIGVAFMTSLNSRGGDGENPNYVALNFSGPNEHPFYSVLKDLIAQNNPVIIIQLSFDTPQQKHIIKLRSDPP